jgi:hypothetical protein
MKAASVSARSGVLAWAAALCGACAYNVQFEPAYVPEETPAFIASGKVVLVIPQEQHTFTYAGPPQSEVGDFTTLTVAIGDIVEEIAEQVFGACFSDGVDVVEMLDYDDEFVVALMGDMEDFVYRYRRVIDQGFIDDQPETWIVPEVEIAFSIKALNHDGDTLLEKTYDSGVRAGESYVVTSRPEERINRTLHATLHELMLDVAADLRPLLVGECTITEIA